MTLTKSSWLIVGSLAVLIIVIAYAIGTDKRPSDEFDALTGNKDGAPPQGSQNQPQTQQSQQGAQTQTPVAATPGAEGSFGLKVITPWQGESLVRGAKYTVTWQGLFTDRVKISLRRQGSAFNLLVVENQFASTQKYEWTVPTTLALANDYYFVVVPQIQSYTRAATSPIFRISDEGVVSAVKSVVEASPTSVAAEPNCFATVSVRILNQYELPVPGKKVVLSTERPNTNILASNDTTNTNGAASFRVGSQMQGTAIFIATVEGVRVNDTAVVSFLNPPPFCNTR